MSFAASPPLPRKGSRRKFFSKLKCRPVGGIFCAAELPLQPQPDLSRPQGNRATLPIGKLS